MSKKEKVYESVEEQENETGEIDPEPKEHRAARLGRRVQDDYMVRGVSVGLALIVVICALVDGDKFIAAVGVLRKYVTQYCSWWIILMTALALILCVVIAASKYGKITLGGKDAKPAFSYFSWFAMLFATGQGVGLVFWAVAEPLMMLGNVTAGSPWALQDTLFAPEMGLAWTYFHWGIPAWPIYAIVSLFLAYARYNCKKDNTFRGSVEDLFKGSVRKVVGIIVEILAVLATIFGLTTSLGLASFQFNTGVQTLFGITTPFAVQVGWVILFGCLATLSVWLGVVKGIKNISNFNAVTSIVLMVLVFVLGPTLYILGMVPESLGVYIDQFMLMTGFSEAQNLASGIEVYADSWQTWWSFFIFCWCFAFATFTAGFISTISRGRTLREFLIGVCAVGGGVCIVWTVIMGGAGIWAALQQAVAAGVDIADYAALSAFFADPASMVAQTNANSSAGLFLTIQSLPAAPLLTLVATILIGGYIVTSVDSGVMALSNFVSPAAKDSRAFKAVLALSITALATVFFLAAGADVLNAIQFATVAGGVPFSIVVVLMAIQFFKWVKHDPELVESGEAEPMPEEWITAQQLKAYYEYQAEKEAAEAAAE